MSSPHARVSPVAAGRQVRSRLDTEFGALLEPLVCQTPGGVAAVLSDEEGNAIDFAHDPLEMSELDVQLLAAQVGQSILRIRTWGRNHRIEPLDVVLETPRSSLLATALRGTYILALQLEHRANLARALVNFPLARQRIEALLP